MEYALHEDMAHSGITEELATLILECGGKDLRTRIKTVDNTDSSS
jgi:glycine cleavage system regulatory protein